MHHPPPPHGPYPYPSQPPPPAHRQGQAPQSLYGQGQAPMPYYGAPPAYVPVPQAIYAQHAPMAPQAPSPAPSMLGAIGQSLFRSFKGYLLGGAVMGVAAVGFVGYVQVTHKTKIVIDNPTAAALTVKVFQSSVTVPAGGTQTLEVSDAGEGKLESKLGAQAGPTAALSIPRFRLMSWLSSDVYVFVPKTDKRTIAVVPMGYGSASAGEIKLLQPGLHRVAGLSTFEVNAAFPQSVDLQHTKNSKPTGKVLRHLCHATEAADEVHLGCPGAG